MNQKNNDIFEKEMLGVMNIEGIGPNRIASGTTFESISWPMNDLIYCKIELNREWSQIMGSKYGMPSAHQKILYITTYLKEFE